MCAPSLLFTTMNIKVENTIEAVNEWLLNVGASAMPQVKIPAQSGIGRLMSGMFGIDLSTYNVWNELGFLLTPTLDAVVRPKLGEFLANIPEEGYEDVVMRYVDSAINQARKQGYVNLFGIQLGPNAFEGLKDILQRKLNA